MIQQTQPSNNISNSNSNSNSNSKTYTLKRNEIIHNLFYELYENESSYINHCVNTSNDTANDTANTNSFLSLNEQQTINKLMFQNENDLINHITQYLKDRLLIRFPFNYELFNTQKSYWMPQNNQLKERNLTTIQFISHIMYVCNDTSTSTSIPIKNSTSTSTSITTNSQNHIYNTSKDYYIVYLNVQSMQLSMQQLKLMILLLLNTYCIYKTYHNYNQNLIIMDHFLFMECYMIL